MAVTLGAAVPLGYDYALYNPTLNGFFPTLEELEFELEQTFTNYENGSFDSLGIKFDLVLNPVASQNPVPGSQIVADPASFVPDWGSGRTEEEKRAPRQDLRVLRRLSPNYASRSV